MIVAELSRAIVPNSWFCRKVEEMSGDKVSVCFQCAKCTNGCPVTFAMDIAPHRLMHSIQLGLKGEVLHSDTIWVCASCETCNTRCPNDIDVAHIMDTLRQISQGEGIRASQSNVPIFHSVFLSSVRKHGRVSEMEMALIYYLKSQGLTGLLKQAGMGFRMFIRGKIKLIPTPVRGMSQVRTLFRKAEEKR